MKCRILVPLLLAGSLTTLCAQSPPPQPWFSEPLVQFLDNPQVTCLGWSRNGKVALFVPVDAGGRGGSVVRMVLLDTVEDRVLMDQEQWGDEFDRVRDEPPLLARDMEQSQSGRDYLEACFHAGIEPADPTGAKVYAFPLIYQGLKLGARVVTAPFGDIDDYGSRSLDYRIVVTSEGRGEKTIARAQANHAFDITVDGYALSPFEPRMVVVYDVTQPGFEGERPATYGFSGCHLKVGFVNK